jgi:cytoskeletal protein CcmA (bactofilin family)
VNFVIKVTQLSRDLPIGGQADCTPGEGTKMALKSFRTARSERDSATTTSEGPALPAPSSRPPRTVAPSTSIDATSVLEGTLRCKETIRIDGHLKGELICDKTVIVGEGAKVHANIVADRVQVSGEVRGDITARSKLTMDRTARVTGNLVTPGVVIEEGAKLEGRLVIGSDAMRSPEPAQVEPVRRAAKPARPAPMAAAPPPA